MRSTTTSLTVSDAITCINCDDDENETKIGIVVLHLMTRYLQGQIRANTDTAPTQQLLVCFFSWKSFV